MAERQLKLSCERFRKDLNPEDDSLIRTTSLQDVRTAIAQTERELASRQALRSFDRLTPYINAVERYGKVVEVFCNSSPIVPYIWGPLKLIILAIKEQTRALDLILAAYAQIGNALPRMTALQQSMMDNHDFQLLFAFLHEDITEFHRRVYILIRRPAWTVFFASAWGRFERHFSALIDNIRKTSDLIDKQAATYHILEVKEWREKSLDDSATREKRWETEQLQAVLNWLGTEVPRNQELMRDWLNARSHEGTSSWIMQNTTFRSWLQRGRGSQILWMHGKPGSGKSVLVSKIISFVSSDANRRVFFFFCDYRTQGHEVSTQILKAYLAQCISCDPGIVPFLYDEYLAKGQHPVANVLKQALMAVFKSMDFVRLVVDGIDEVQVGEHKVVLRELMQFTKSCGENCKLLIASQDLPSIRPTLRGMPHLFLGDERNAIDKDIGVVVDGSLRELYENLDGVLREADKVSLRASILTKAEGMFLWVNLVLALLETSSSLYELKLSVDALPKDLEEMYEKLLSNIRRRCTPRDEPRVSRIFEWLLFANERSRVQKFEVLVGSSLHQDCMALDRDKRPFPNALDVCKPLIEDGPGGTVALIHSTLASFLVSPRSGLSISARTAHEHIAFACVSHLVQILEFAQSDFQIENMAEVVGLGCLALQHYASENWTFHVSKYAELIHSELSPGLPLIRQLLRLTARHDGLLRALPPVENAHEQHSVSSSGVESWLQRLSAFPELCDLIRRVHSFRDEFSTQQALDGPDILAVDYDTTLFSRADSNYHAVVEFLLQATDCMWIGLSPDDLAAFRSQFGDTAFVCPVRDCDRSRLGYPSAAELQNHKTRRHGQRLRCYQGSCIHNDIGFANESSLRQHVQRVHRKVAPPIPTRLNRSSRAAEDIQQPEHTQLSAQVGVKRGHVDGEGLPGPSRPGQSQNDRSDWFVIHNSTVPRVLDVKLVHTLAHESAVFSVKFSMDGKYIGTGGNLVARIFDVISGKEVCVLQDKSADTTRDSYIRSVCFSPDGRCLATASDDAKMRVWDIQSRTIRATLSGHEQEVHAVDCSRDGRIIASASGDRTVRLWDLEARTEIQAVTIDAGISTVAISPDCSLIAAGSLDNAIHLRNIETGHLVGRFTGHNDHVSSIAFSPDGRGLVSSSLDKTIKTWELGASRDGLDQGYLKTFKVEGHQDSVRDVTITPDAQWILASSKDRGLQFWDPVTGHNQVTIQGHPESVSQMATSPTGRYFAFASGDKHARIWSYRRI